MSIVGDEVGIIQPQVFRPAKGNEDPHESYEYTCRDLNNYGRLHGMDALFDFINDNAGKRVAMP